MPKGERNWEHKACLSATTIYIYSTGICVPRIWVVDAWDQAAHSGEINVPLKKGLICKKDIYADIGEIVVGKKPGRTDNSELTVFDSTGLAIQDVAVADLIYQTALKKKIGKWITII